MSLSEQEEQRRKSREEIIDLGIDPYPSDTFEVNTYTDEIKNNFDEKKKNYQDVVLAGRLMSRRVMGSASFAEIQDSKGKIQIYVRRDDICEGEDKTLYSVYIDSFCLSRAAISTRRGVVGSLQLRPANSFLDQNVH